MMNNQINPIFPSIPEAADVLVRHQLASEFRQEVEYREKFEQHCQWYRSVAKQHQLELEAMKKDINLFRWFKSLNY